MLAASGSGRATLNRNLHLLLKSHEEKMMTYAKAFAFYFRKDIRIGFALNGA
jgi:hypothetical protein